MAMKFKNVQDFSNEELEQVIYKKTKINEKAIEKFDLMMGKVPIFNKKDRPLEFVEGEEWRPCFAPDEYGKMFLCPKWFIGNKTGRLISTHFKDKLHWIYPEEDKYGKVFYHFAHPFRMGNTTNTIYAYVLQCVVFPDQVEWLGNSREIYEKYGLAAFCNGKLTIDAHHKLPRLGNPKYAYDVANIQVMPVKAHRPLDNAPRLLDDSKNDIKYAKKIGEAFKILNDAENGTINVAEVGSYNKKGIKIASSKREYGYMDLTELVNALKTPEDPASYEFYIALLYGNVICTKHPDIKAFEMPIKKSVYLYVKDGEDKFFVRWMTSKKEYLAETKEKTADIMDTLYFEMKVDTSTITD